MKDYYKTLGLKETATAEQIRDRWIHLMWKLHPDRGRGGKIRHQKRVKEINEAYQVLKDHSSRMEYDLIRTYGRARRRFSLPKRVLFCIMVLLLALGSIYVKNRWDFFLSGQTIPASPSPTATEPPAPKIWSSAQIENGETTKTIKEELPHKMSKLFRTGVAQGDRGGKIGAVVPSIPPAVSADPVRDSGRGDPPMASGPGVERGTESSESKPTGTTPARVVSGPNPTVSDTVEQRGIISNEPAAEAARMASALHTVRLEDRMDLPSPPPVRAQKEYLSKEDLPQEERTVMSSHLVPERKVPTTRAGQIDQTVAIKDSPSVPVPEKTSVPPNPPSGPQIVLKEEKPVVPSSPPPKIAAEKEVLSFLGSYVQQYNQKDFPGLLQCFSSRAIQNRKHGFDEIKRMYANFFNESRELRYHVEDTKIEIDQDGVKVQARYGIIQTMKKKGETKTWKGMVQWTLVKEQGALKILSLEYLQENPL